MAKVQVVVDGAHVAEQSDGKYIVTVNSRTGQFELEFTSELWTKLGETAAWFQSRALKGQI